MTTCDAVAREQKSASTGSEPQTDAKARRRDGVPLNVRSSQQPLTLTRRQAFSAARGERVSQTRRVQPAHLMPPPPSAPIRDAPFTASEGITGSLPTLSGA